jgi:SAM-dependent methyltransferase
MDIARQLTTTSAEREDGRRERIERRLASSPFLAEPLRRLGYDSRELWAWDNYRASVLAFVEACRHSGRHEEGKVRLLEVGGGRGPLLTPSEAEQAGVTLTVNDIDAGELALAPGSFQTAQFNVAGDFDPKLAGRFDLIVSRMVFEHVRDAPRAWSNVCALLAPGGVGLAFHPTLYAPPFVINWLAPEALTAPILRFFFSDRNQGDYPKFPARYELCFGDPSRVEPTLRRCGFSSVLVAPFWGHRYFRHIPGLRELDAAIGDLAERRDWRLMTSYAYTIARR